MSTDARQCTVAAEPGPFRCDPERTALILIDMQRDFVEPGGFGEKARQRRAPCCAPWSWGICVHARLL
jgi:hypothetical protein